MKNVLLLGASGSLAKSLVPVLSVNADIHLTLFVRNAQSVAQFKQDNITIIEGDVLNQNQLNQAMQGQGIVYAGLAGDLPSMANNIITAMHTTDVKRLIFISSMGIYGETGENHGAILEPYRQSAKIIENSGLDYTVIRPAWFTNGAEIDYQLTQKGEVFRGKSVSRKSIADLIAKIVNNPELHLHESVGIAKV